MRKIFAYISLCLIVLSVVFTFPAQSDASIDLSFRAAYNIMKYEARVEGVKKLQKGVAVSKSANNKTQEILHGDSAIAYDTKSLLSVKFVENKNIYYDIKLSMSKQDYVRKMCKKYDVSFELVLAVMKVESGFNEKAKSKTNDYGIMQINKGNHNYLRKKLGVNNFLDFKENTEAGIYMLSRYTSKHTDIHKVLMCYNLGEGAAAKKWKKGKTETAYSNKVVSAMKELRGK